MGHANFDTDDGKLIQTIKDSVAVEVLDVKPGQFLSRQVELPPQKPLAPPIYCHSLTSIVDYLTNINEGRLETGLVVHVVSPTEVDVFTALANFEDRRFLALKAKADVPEIEVILGGYEDAFIAHANAIIELQSCFVQDGDVLDLLRDLGTLVWDESITNHDDGTSQRVVMQKGIDRVEKTLKNPIRLFPFRTFAEISQPASDFVFRLESDPISIGLFEADGGKWRNEARQSIKQFLYDAGVTVPILA